MRRSLIAFAAFAGGLMLGRGVEAPSVLWFSLASLACAVAGATRGRVCRAGMVLACVLLGAGWFAARIVELPASSLAWHLSGNDAVGAPVLLTVDGVVLDRTRTGAPSRGSLAAFSFGDVSTRFPVRVQAAESQTGWTSVSGTVWVQIDGPLRTELLPGDRVRLTGLVTPVGVPLNPGEPDRRLWSAQDGAVGTIRLSDEALVERLAPGESWAARISTAWISGRAVLRARAGAVLGIGEGAGPDAGRMLLAALLLGEHEPGLRDVRSAFTRLGLAHVLAISGFHLAVMAAAALAVVRLSGDRGWAEPATVAALVAVYLIIAPAEAPVLRSGVMVLALLATESCGRRYDRLAVLGWVGVGMLIWRPLDLWSLGFQLSFGLTGALLWLGSDAPGRLFGRRLLGTIEPAPRWRGWAAEWAKRLVAVNLLCWAAAAPVIAHRTGLVSPLGMLATMVVLPPVVVALWIGYAALLIGMVVPPAGDLAGAVLGEVGSWTVGLVRWLDGVPGASFHVPAVSAGWAAGATLVVLYWFWRGTRRDGAAWTVTVLVALWAGVELWSGYARAGLRAGVALRIDMLAVGDGSCHLVRSEGGGGGESLLWDCGSLSLGVGETLLPRAVRALGAGPVRTVVVSHPDIDHYSGLLDVIEPLGVRRVVLGEAFRRSAERHPRGPAAFVRGALEARGVEVRWVGAGDVIELGGARLTFLSPPAGATWPDENDRSLVALVESKPGAEAMPTLLLTGDIQDRAMAHLAGAHPGLRADIMELPHHGSSRPAAHEFVGRIDPTVVLQSTGPGRAADERWAHVRRGRRWYTSATDGAAWAEARRDGTVRSGAFRVGRAAVSGGGSARRDGTDHH